jgi:cardiolipin synthase
MRGLCCFLAVILIFPTVQLGLPSSPIEEIDLPSFDSSDLILESQNQDLIGTASVGDQENQTSLLIWEVCPSFTAEFITLMNNGECELDLKGIYLTDGEGTVTFNENLILNAGQILTICTNISTIRQMSIIDLAVELGSRYLISKGTFRLADKGDEVLMFSPLNNLLDAFVYGSSEFSGEGWKGSPFPKVDRGHSALRNGYFDTDCAGDWETTVPGRSSLSCASGWYTVEPFIIPVDGRERLIREIDFSTRTILMALYKINDPVIVDRLCKSSLRGVNVTILVEGQPVAGIDDAERGSLRNLLASGVDIRLLQSHDGYKRYQYIHCKYAIFDGHRTCVMSENLITYSLDSNRGWGVLVDSDELARYFSRIFIEDADLSRMDVKRALKDDFKVDVMLDRTDITISSIEHQKFSCQVRPIISPDFSFELIHDIISSAQKEILIEQLYCDLSLENELLRGILDAARRGIKVRFLLDSSFFAQSGSNNQDLIEELNIIGVSENIDLQARMVSSYHDFAVLHNKGVIVDNHVIVSSINWCEGAFFENREAGLILSSSSLADYFSKFYWDDWNIDPYPPVVSIDASEKVHEGEMILISGRNSSDNAGISEYLWDLDGDGVFDQTGSMVVATFPEGVHTVLLRVTDIYNNSAEATQIIQVLPGSDSGFDLILLSPIMMVAPFLIWLFKKD